MKPQNLINQQAEQNKAQEFNVEDSMVFVDLADGKVKLSIFLSNVTDEELDPCMLKWIESENQVSLLMHFTPASPVDYLIEGHEMPSQNNAISIKAKPVFDALRAELQAQVARLDAIVYAAHKETAHETL